MSERYSKLYSLPVNLYASGSPIIIAAGALLKDNQTGKVLAQLKLRSISNNRIRAVIVSIQPKDTIGKILGDSVSYQYLDLNIGRDGEFGQKTPVMLPDATTRAFDVVVTDVVFCDNSVWNEATDTWDTLPGATSLHQPTNDLELIKQYKLVYGAHSNFIYTEAKDLWYCDCGSINRNDENCCHSCGTESATIKSVDWDALKDQKDERLAVEKAKAEAKAEAERLERERQAEIARMEAEKRAKRNKKIAIIATPFVCAVIAFVIILNTVIIPNGKYNDAVALMDAGKIVEAYEALIALDGYKDSDEKAKALLGQYLLECCVIGDYITFGIYEQDNNTTNGKEDIEWLVLDKKDGKALVISKNALDCQQYNTSYTDVTWETSSLREWLNGTFINAAFTDAEKSLIPTVTASSDKNPEYSTNPGSATQDKVFLLSITEVNKYFSSDSARQCEATAYAEAQDAYVSSSNGNCWWWLRSPGVSQNSAACVLSVGDVGEGGNIVSFSNYAVRPALWIDLEL